MMGVLFVYNHVHRGIDLGPDPLQQDIFDLMDFSSIFRLENYWLIINTNSIAFEI